LVKDSSKLLFISKIKLDLLETVAFSSRLVHQVTVSVYLLAWHCGYMWVLTNSLNVILPFSTIQPQARFYNGDQAHKNCITRNQRKSTILRIR